MSDLSDVFKYTQGLGQKGHQIGRKVGDAIELLTLAMIYKDESLAGFLIIEDGVEGATTAKHKVEFAFYNHNEENLPINDSENLFAIIECKKVGVEQTIKQSFKSWISIKENKKNFYETGGHSFSISPSNAPFKWQIEILPSNEDGNLIINVQMIEGKEIKSEDKYVFNCIENTQILIVQDINNQLYLLNDNQSLMEIENSLKKCIIVHINKVSENKVEKIHIDEALAGPQTPEKAKQSSFVSLDVRKKVLGSFDKTDNDDFISILVIGEASHWEDKSRAMIRLCNDYNLVIPDQVLIKLFQSFDENIGENYQDSITKTKYKTSENVRNLVNNVIDSFEGKILYDMDNQNYVEFEHFVENNKNKLRLKTI